MSWWWSGLSLLLCAAWLAILLLNLPDLLRVPRLPKREAGASGSPEAAWTGVAEARTCPGNTPATVFSSHTQVDDPDDHAVRSMVSVVIPARNEQERLPDTLAAWAEQTYPAFEVIVVDDRSEDETGSVADAFAATDARFRVVHITDLPTGWLGKNHALQRGAEVACGEWLLFADADVRFAPDALARTMAHVQRRPVDHLTVAPRVIARGYWLRALTALFAYNLVLFKRPQSAYRHRSRAYAGIGAFNLVRRSLYEHIGGHQSLALRPDDDIQLGRIVKRGGGRQEFALADDFMEIEWYPTLVEMFRGLEKSPLAAFHYSITALLASLIPLLVLYDGPFACVLFAPGWWRLPSVGALLVMFVLYTLVNQFLRFPKHQFLLLPITLFLFMYTFVRSAWMVVRRGGLLWRGTVYPLAELRRGL
ncbi:glycosyltransferase [Alicyclobacillus herbarius]|uniref:glycosyltransferase n=1 Tax=Alicyclobacillus herbarius TaxID=122960 RepID=UPI0004046BFF|nr:glycosyltransferase family 2 protein [Alicyclobacillus herbarius]